MFKHENIGNLVLRIYRLISVDILTQNIDRVKIIKTHKNVGKLLRNDIRSNNNTYIIIET